MDDVVHVGQEALGWSCFVDTLQTSMVLLMRTFAFISQFDAADLYFAVAQMGSLGFCDKITPSLGSQAILQMTSALTWLLVCLIVTSTSAPNLRCLPLSCCLLLIAFLLVLQIFRSEPTGFDPLPIGLRGSGRPIQNALDIEMNADHMMSREKLVVIDDQTKIVLQFLLW